MTIANERLRELNDNVTTALLTQPPFGVLPLTSNTSRKAEQISSTGNQISLWGTSPCGQSPWPQPAAL